jgi:hypothetical protein
VNTFDTIITAKIARGTLPCGAQDNTSIGHGHGKLCDGCDAAVLETNTEVAVGFTQGRALRFHLDCFGLWRFAARAAAEATRSPAGRQASRDRPRSPR